VNLEVHLEAEIERVWRCTLEAVIERVRRCTWRPLSCELRHALGGGDRASSEMHLKAVIVLT